MVYRYYNEIWYLSFFPLVGAILFFLPTKKKAVITAIPYFLYIIPALVLAGHYIYYAFKYADVGQYGDLYSVIVNLFYALIPLICVALAVIYGIGVSVKKRSTVFTELYIIGATTTLVMIAALTLPSFASYLGYVFRDKYMDFGTFMRNNGTRYLYEMLAWFAALYTHIACVLALKAKAKE